MLLRPEALRRYFFSINDNGSLMSRSAMRRFSDYTTETEELEVFMMHSIKTCVVVLCLFNIASSLPLRADQGQDSDANAPEEMLFENVTVASIKEMDLRESPGIVSVVTADEVKNSGARDLIDVLRLVPGIEFGSDVQGYVSLGIRGMWASNGSVELLIDGNEMNEPLYSDLMFSNQFPVDQIKRIEIIRGPGSAIYGGSAELCVINIVTKDTKDIKGFAGSATYGVTSTYAQRGDGSLSYGIPLGLEDGIVSSVFLGQGRRSDLPYTDFNGNTYNMTDNSSITPLNANVKLKYQGLNVDAMVDSLHTQQKDEYGINLPA
ncbi:MAG: TonB-dependent receptor plug domain-containing protein, partial [Endomicrobiales bacterium]